MCRVRRAPSGWHGQTQQQDGATSESSSSGEHQLKDHTFPQQQQQYQIKYFSANANLFSYTLNRTTLNYN